MSNQNSGDDTSGPQPTEACAAGDGRERNDTRYKPGQSGNPKGRPKGSKNYGAQLHKLYTEPVVVNQGGKRRRVAALVAVHQVQLQRALTGDKRATEIVLKTAKEFGFGPKTEMHECVCRYNLSDAVIARLTNQTLAELIRVEKELEAEEENAKKKLH
jgi:hypothetical protein